MSWIITGVTGGASLINSLINNEAKRKNDEAARDANAAVTRFSPWTHASIQSNPAATATSDLAAGLGGGLQGALAGHMMSKQFATAPVAEATTPTDIGGAGFSKQIGDQAENFQGQMGNQMSSWDQLKDADMVAQANGMLPTYFNNGNPFLKR